MTPRKTVFTTGEVAKICNVAPRTVSKWFDSGHLRGYRIPGSKDRRIPLDQLIHFMRAHGLPLNGLGETGVRVLVLDRDMELWDTVRQAMPAEPACDISVATTAFEAGAAANEMKPGVVIVDVTLPDVETKGLVRSVRSLADLQETRLIAIATGLTEAQGHALLQDGFDGYLSKPFELSELMDQLEKLVFAPVGSR